MPTFKDWFIENLSDYAKDIAEHGADGGYPHLTWNAEVAEVFDKFEEDIWEMAVADAEDQGYKNVAHMIGDFTRADMLSDFTTFKVLLVWYMAETVARELQSEEDTLA